MLRAGAQQDRRPIYWQRFFLTYSAAASYLQSPLKQLRTRVSPNSFSGNAKTASFISLAFNSSTASAAQWRSLSKECKRS
jgi:hypothetical protein